MLVLVPRFQGLRGDDMAIGRGTMENRTLCGSWRTHCWLPQMELVGK
jgi:hypothetical protein